MYTINPKTKSYIRAGHENLLEAARYMDDTFVDLDNPNRRGPSPALIMLLYALGHDMDGFTVVTDGVKVKSSGADMGIVELVRELYREELSRFACLPKLEVRMSGRRLDYRFIINNYFSDYKDYVVLGDCWRFDPVDISLLNEFEPRRK